MRESLKAWRGGTRPFMLADRRAMKVRVAPRWREDDMFKSMLRRSVPSLTLATILFITCAGTAQARTFTPAGEAWSWLRQVWMEGVGLWGGAAVAPTQGPRTVRGLQKNGPGVDPNGGQPLSSPSCTTCAGQGAGADPNGRP